jgi:predicted nucleotide-binding protein
VLSGASIAFGLIEGGAQAASISLTPLATRIVRPKTEDEDTQARREAVLRPRVFREFLERYNGHAFPRTDIAVNVLEEMGVPRGKATEVLERLEGSAKAVGFLHSIKDKLYVDLSGTEIPSGTAEEDGEGNNSATANEAGANPPVVEAAVSKSHPQPTPVATIVAHGTTLSAAVADDARRRRVFITHGKDRALVDPIKKLLEYGELEPVVSVERQSVSKPVPEKFMGEMRQAGAAIIHVDAERTLRDEEGNEHVMLNPNVLIEIGAAMAFYGRRFILLVRDGVKLPSNLQGLYEVRYKGDTLDADATIRLLEAMKDIKNQPLPTSIAVSD